MSPTQKPTVPRNRRQDKLSRRHEAERLDEALKETFPASDPVELTESPDTKETRDPEEPTGGKAKKPWRPRKERESVKKGGKGTHG